MKRSVLVVVGIVGSVAIGGVLTWQLWPEPPLPVFDPNGPPPMDLVELIPEDLRIDEPELLDKNNAYPKLVDAMASFAPLSGSEREVTRAPSTNQGYKPPTRAEKERVFAKLKKQQPLFDRIDKILGTYPLVWPKPNKPWDLSVTISNFRGISTSLRGAQYLYLENGDAKTALSLALQNMRIGLAFFNAKGTSTERLVITQLATSLVAASDFAKHPLATDEAILKLLRAMPEELSLEGEEYAVKADVLLYARYLETVRAGEVFTFATDSQVVPGAILHKRAFDRKATFDIFVKALRPVLKEVQAGLPPNVKRPAPVAAIPWSANDTNWLLKWLGHYEASIPEYDFKSAKDRRLFWQDLQDLDNPLGQALVYQMHYYMADMERDSLLRTIAAYRLTRLTCGLRAYERRYGSYPSSLDKLVSTGILARLPVDPVTRQSLGYNAKLKKLWSVGENGKDEGGKSERPGAWAQPDFVYELP